MPTIQEKTTMTTENNILFAEIPGVGGNLGVITLNRPRALNALTLEMCQALDERLEFWAANPRIKAVIIQATEGRAFCAGGDVLQLYQQGIARHYSALRAFFWQEYRLNSRIRHFPKPYISLLNGITMGGGAGISIHGSHRVVTEQFMFAMPETAIGFFPDIGASFFLSRCPGEIGIYLALTGTRINAADALYAELGDHFISSHHLPTVIDAIADTRFSQDARQTVTDLLAQMSVKTEATELFMHREIIDHCFSADSIEEIFTNLANDPRPWAHQTLRILHTKSPTSLKVTLKALRDGVSLNFSGCMKMEFRLCQRLVRHPDFYSGVKSVLLEKNKTAPKWHPGEISGIAGEEIERYFAPLEDGELMLEGE
jgi:enoyl-CoA hydratase